jgi:DNA-binding HxlR family transcriptional regulator
MLQMEDLIRKYSETEHCPIRNIISRFSSKWGMLILILLSERSTLRFKDLLSCLPDISSKVLSSTLKSLEEDGLIAREVYPTLPPKVEYSLTETGRSLMPLFADLIKWAVANYDKIMSHRNSK